MHLRCLGAVEMGHGVLGWMADQPRVSGSVLLHASSQEQQTSALQ